MVKNPAQYPTQTCPRCHGSLTCKAEAISGCQCKHINLTHEQSDFIRQQYAGCLCFDCLKVLKAVFENTTAPMI